MWIDRQDLLYCIRSARRSPLLTLVAIAALTLGIGLNAGVFTLLNAMFLTPHTQKDPASFVQIYPRYEGWFTGAGQYSVFTTEDYEAIRAHSRALADTAAWQLSFAFLEQGRRSMGTLLVTCNYFHVFGVDQPLMGRFFTPGECARGTAVQVAVLTAPFWKYQFGSDPHIVGKTIHLNGLPFQVVGIVPGEAAQFFAAGVFVPFTVQPLLDHSSNLFASPDATWLNLAGRLRPAFTRADATAELGTIMRQQDRAYVERNVSVFNRKTSIVLTNGSFVENPAVRGLVTALMVLILGPLSLVLLLACTNVTMMFLSRTIVRRGEIAIRLALGVGRVRLARMLLLESLLVTAVSGVMSVVLAYRVPLLIMNIANPSQSGLVPLMRPDWHVFGYMAALVGLASIVSSLAPMHAAWKLDLLTALKGREGGATMRSRTTSGLIIGQIAMSFVLMAAAVLFGRLPGMVTGMDPGFEIRRTMTVPLDLNTSGQNRTAALDFYRALETRIQAIPNVQSLAYATLPPFRPVTPSEIRMPGQTKGQGRPASVDVVTRDFFATFDIRLLGGRVFQSSDTSSAGQATVAVVSQAFAKEFWPGLNPIGNSVVISDDRKLTVVGVVAETRSEHFGILDGPRLYVLRDSGSLDGMLYVRFTGSATTAESAVRKAVRAIDPTQIAPPQTIWESLEDDAEGMRSLARIILVMAAIAVLLAITGVYGVLSFAVNQRTREFGVKMVLGANRRTIFQSIMIRGVRQIALGLVLGVILAEPAAWMFARIIKNSPVPFRSFDAPVFGIAAVLLAVVSIVSIFLPALRATRVDPLDALRAE